MAERLTMPVSLVGLPLRALRIEVTQGPDRGLAFTSQTETITALAREIAIANVRPPKPTK